MSKLEMDAIDASFLVLNTMAGFLLVGIGSFDLFGVNFGETLFTVSGIGLSTAWIIGYSAIIGTLVTNDNADLSSLSDDVRNLEGYYYAAAAGALALPVAFVVFPDTVASFFKSADLWGLSYVVLITSGQTALGWML